MEIKPLGTPSSAQIIEIKKANPDWIGFHVCFNFEFYSTPAAFNVVAIEIRSASPKRFIA